MYLLRSLLRVFNSSGHTGSNGTFELSTVKRFTLGERSVKTFILRRKKLGDYFDSREFSMKRLSLQLTQLLLSLFGPDAHQLIGFR